MPSHRGQKALAFIDTFKDLDYQANVALRAPNCRHQFGPATVGIPEKDNQAFASHVKMLSKTVEGIPCKAEQIFEGGDSVTLHATSTTLFREEVVKAHPELNWVYEGEYMFVFTFDENDKIKHVLEFLDSKKVHDLWALMKSAGMR